VRAENLVHSSGQQSCCPCRPAVIIIGRLLWASARPEDTPTISTCSARLATLTLTPSALRPPNTLAPCPAGCIRVARSCATRAGERQQRTGDGIRPQPCPPPTRASAVDASCGRHGHRLFAAPYQVLGIQFIRYLRRPGCSFTGNTLRVILRRAEVNRDGLHGRHSSPPGTLSSRSSTARPVDTRTVFPYSQFSAVAHRPIWGNGLCRSSDT
jgi:hypothetical protein